MSVKQLIIGAVIFGIVFFAFSTNEEDFPQKQTEVTNHAKRAQDIIVEERRRELVNLSKPICHNGILFTNIGTQVIGIEGKGVACE